MPGSVPYFDDVYIEHIKLLKPNSVLDVGVGAAKYGFLTRQSIPHCNIHGLEPELSYLEKYKTSGIYNKIYNKSIQQFVREDMNNQEKYDLVVFGDILEHLFLSEAYDVLNFFSTRCKWLIVQFPSNMPQFAVDGINWEVHRSNLELKDFIRYNVIYYASVKQPNYNEFHQYVVMSMLLDSDKVAPIKCELCPQLRN